MGILGYRGPFIGGGTRSAVVEQFILVAVLWGDGSPAISFQYLLNGLWVQSTRSSRLLDP